MFFFVIVVLAILAVIVDLAVLAVIVDLAVIFCVQIKKQFFGQPFRKISFYC